MGNRAAGGYHAAGLGYYSEKKYVEAFVQFGLAAELVFFDSMYQQALMLLSGLGCERNPDAAIVILKKLGGLKYAEALVKLGNIYIDGLIVEQDIDLGIRYYDMAAGLGHVMATFFLGEYFISVERGRKVGLGIKYLNEAGGKNHIGALMMLANMYQRGEVVEKSRELSKKYFTQAYGLGSVEAAHQLALLIVLPEYRCDSKDFPMACKLLVECYDKNYIPGVETFALVLYWSKIYGMVKISNILFRAHREGSRKVSYPLACIYLKEKTKKDDLLAVKYLEEAVQEGNIDACVKLGDLCKRCDDPSSAEDYYYRAFLGGHPRGIIKWIKYMISNGGNCSVEEKHIQMLLIDVLGKGYGEAGHLLGNFYYEKYVTKSSGKSDLEMAVTYYEKALKMGYFSSALDLALIFARTEKSNYYISLIESSGDRQALLNLGRHYWDNVSLIDDVPNKKIVEILEKAAMLKSRNSYRYLSMVYSDNSDIQNLDRALYWAKKAYEAGSFKFENILKMFGEEFIMSSLQGKI
ncbi:MAG: hypothetical protein Hyperionvirus1_202 [Hyperionvirus sp.]|uniref:Sel1 repeat family protein n=1 Tax=Hyperionvirus sp. TaxID=2487770 RepID=A0A3G5A9U9_9VIRU|nr:MAG: hypothetical protein Hyperionvirus1_202 [Hyperionvirus sp.]